MVPEATLERTEHGSRPVSEGWFVVNVRETRWFGNELGRYALLDSDDARFDQVGVAVGMILPGQPNAMYHACLLYTSPSPRDGLLSRMPSSA